MEIEERLASWRADLLAGRARLDHKLTSEKEEKRRALQKEHQRRRNAEKQRIRRQTNGGFAAVGKALIYGVPGTSDADSALIDAELAQPSFSETHGLPPAFQEDYGNRWEMPAVAPRPVAAVHPRVVECIDLRD